MKITTKDNQEIDVTDWIDDMLENVRLGREVLDRTPIGKTANRGFYWADEEINPPLNPTSVRKLVKEIKKLVLTKQKSVV